MEFITNAQQKAINKLSNIKSSQYSKAKGFFPERRFKPKDISKMITNRSRVAPTLKSVFKTATVIKAHNITANYKTHITKEEFISLDDYIINHLGMDSWGVATFNEIEIFKGDSIQYKKVIVMSRHMDKKEFVTENLPNMDCMLEVMKVYGDTGIASLKATEFLRQMNFGAIPNHSLGGNIDYTKAGYKANLGYIGKHGMLITPHSGSCNRLSVVYTSIDNLEEFLDNREDFSFGKDFCNKCNQCVKACPYDAIYKDSKVDDHGHVECISNEKCNSGFKNYGCGICIAVCPFTKVGYPKIKDSFIKSTTK